MVWHERFWTPGQKDHSEIPLWLNGCDIFCFPSYYEGLPNAVMEAMACERPVVATKVGGIPEIVDDGFTGYLVHLHDIGRLVDMIERLILDRALREKMGKRAREKIISHSSWKKNAEILTCIFKGAMLNYKPPKKAVYGKYRSGR